MQLQLTGGFSSPISLYLFHYLYLLFLTVMVITEAITNQMLIKAEKGIKKKKKTTKQSRRAEEEKKGKITQSHSQDDGFNMLSVTA